MKNDKQNNSTHLTLQHSNCSFETQMTKIIQKKTNYFTPFKVEKLSDQGD